MTLNLGAGNGTVGTRGHLTLGLTNDSANATRNSRRADPQQQHNAQSRVNEYKDGFNLISNGTSTLNANSANYVMIFNWNDTIGKKGNASDDRLIFDAIAGFSAGSVTNQIAFQISTLFITPHL